MAGLPAPVVERAREILAHLERQQLSLEETARSDDSEKNADGDGVASSQAEPDAVPDLPEENRMQRSQMSLFQAEPDPVAEELKEALAGCDPDRMTPIEALMKLADLKSKVEG